MNVLEESDQVREALRHWHRKGKLDVIEAVIGIPVKDLRRIMKSQGEIELIERIVLLAQLVQANTE